jgi:hypothetical protein
VQRKVKQSKEEELKEDGQCHFQRRIAFLTQHGSHSQRIGSHSSRSIKQSHWNEFFQGTNRGSVFLREGKKTPMSD